MKSTVGHSHHKRLKSIAANWRVDDKINLEDLGPAHPAILIAILSAGAQELTRLPKGHEWYEFPSETAQKLKMNVYRRLNARVCSR